MTTPRSAGARFLRAALQVNPFSYVQRNGTDQAFADEHEYNSAMVDAAVAEGIDLVGLTDHHSVRDSESLRTAMNEAGITVFPGFEAHTKEGVHILVLFDPATPVDVIDRCIGSCGITSSDNEYDAGDLDIEQLCARTREWNAVAIAAHATNDKGLLRTLRGSARSRAWGSENLLGAAIPGAIADAPHEFVQILKNQDPAHQRMHPLAILNARDVSSPQGFSADGASSLIKMSAPTIESLRQALLDPGSRVRLASDELPDAFNHLQYVSWEGGFLDGLRIDLSENLNVLVGGRGAGKSTILESIRFALNVEPYSNDARTAHRGFVDKVLKAGTKVVVGIRSANPNPCSYEVSRSVGASAVVRGEQGETLDLTPLDIFPRIQVLGQHEIADLSKLPHELTRLIQRHVSQSPGDAVTERDLLVDLESSRTDVLKATSSHDRLADELEAIPALEERKRRFEQLGLTERLQEQEVLLALDGALERAIAEVAGARHAVDGFEDDVADPGDPERTGASVREAIPSVSRIDEIMGTFHSDVSASIAAIRAACELASNALDQAAGEISHQAAPLREQVERVLRELQQERIDGGEFVQVQRQLDRLKAKQTELEAARARSEAEFERRAGLLTSLEELREERFRILDRTVKSLNRRLAPDLRIAISHQGDRQGLFEFLSNEIGGRQDVIRRQLSGASAVSLRELASCCRDGSGQLQERFGIGGRQAEALAALSEDSLMRMEVVELQTTTNLELNIAAPGGSPVWRGLSDLSTGQRATAVLLLLLLDGDAPLVIDQPEDDLDNSFIASSVVPRLRSEKNRRQFVLSSHNPNIPVLADAELIVVLSADGDADGDGRARLQEVGSVDTEAIRPVIEVLEGGQQAFQIRRRKYGF